jgi:NAD(P)-dependent dehydrogenase (short-subunit alcohol dehydrogenase family)
LDIALVTGGRGALGSVVAATLSARGDRVLALEREQLDVSDPDAVDAYWEGLASWGELPRWVVNTVGGFDSAPLADMPAEDVRAQLALNLESALWTSRAAARHLGEGSAIVHVASRTALKGGAGSAAYAVAKAGVVRLTEVLAEELAPKRIRVNAVLPSTISTPANRSWLSREKAALAVPPEQVASVIAFLCSDDAAAVSGAAVPVYGWA